MTQPDLLARSLAAVWHPCTQMKRHEMLPLVPITRGEGVWLHGQDGERYLDAVSSWWVNLFGHGAPRIRQAIKDQLDTLEHVMLAGFTHEPVVRLSERLAALSGLGHAFYGSDGASATEIALKMAAHYWKNRGHAGKHRYVYLEGSYHGETVGALAVTDVPVFRSAYAELIGQHFCAPSPDARRAANGESAEQVALRAAAALETLLASHHGEIAAFILEPLVQGASGMVMYHPCYLAEARRLCSQYQVLLIADEIAVGFGRTGSMFAYQQAGITPDLLCLSKGITGGFLPLAAVLCSDDIYAAFYHDDVSRGFLHSHSYTGNPLACAAANAVLDQFEADDVLTSNRDKAQRWHALFMPLAQHPQVQHFRRCGMIWAFEVQDAGNGFALRLFQAALARGILLRPIGNTVYFMPPYVLGDNEANFLSEQTLAALNAALATEAEPVDVPLA
ncbi:Adenosylmethionine-8-amino-7-oxononanoate aminotransferase [Andreprevotia sp. IGB-42]|uniref:adenosylmethionine--8-amino-7-oxononanoate transaminase n=1 Tax=Andreprevotia sp. IGB-42 TaxID=2497473 RepID=UPI00135CD9D3|nr:adenosylmethionine--8-amino-7-oxononanoate transaminase [Andreprevotia sp. IGB-42]KAF0811937.1 Adenosylmethionine-8-amino-7-oxononanoate aminotransferase [Andreprevotia sp. IGB-42]